MNTLESEAAELGIPMQIVIDDETRQEDCDAHAATLVSIDGGKHATYQGQCNMGHHYKVRRLVSELQAEYKKKVTYDVHGEVQYGLGEDFDGGNLEEY
jgi:hypothetical protein